MARPLRIEYSGAVYHVTCRGNARERIYRVDPDRSLFLATLGQVVDRYTWRCHAYCLMPNHYHLVVETLEPSLSRGMRQLNGVYTQEFNRRHLRTGHVFQGRFKAILVQRDAYLLELSRYVVLNPVRAQLARTARDWPWSSYRATAGLEPAAPFLTTAWLLDQFHTSTPRARDAYRAFVSAGRGATIWENLRGQIYLGDEAFVEEHATSNRGAAEVPRAQWLADRPALGDVVTGAHDNAGIALAYRDYGYTLAQIGAHVGVHYVTISRRVRAWERAQSERQGDA